MKHESDPAPSFTNLAKETRKESQHMPRAIWEALNLPVHWGSEQHVLTGGGTSQPREAA